MNSIKHFKRLLIVSLIVAWIFDQLFWRQVPGISFFIYVLVCLSGGFLITWWEGRRPALSGLWLLIPTLFFAVMTFIRMDPLAYALSFVLTLACLAVLTMTWLGGKWLAYSLSDYAIGSLRLAGSALGRPVMSYIADRKAKRALIEPGSGQPVAGAGAETTADGPVRVTSRPGQALPILRGVLLAIPVIAVLAALLASADPIFSQNLDAFLKLFRIENLGEYIFRAIYILIGAYLLVGLYLHAIGPSHDESLIGLEKPWLAPFLGWTEAIIVLGAVDLLFAFFVGIQFRYFFGGAANINSAGYTYAEYARRGFNELLAVAVISLLLFLALSSLTRREQRHQRRSFTGLGVGLLVLVGVILVSAFQRLLLYEAAYGFTRIRTYTHVFMVWVGILLAVTVILEVLGRMRSFALGVALVSLGFGVTVCLLNVDGFIARQNIARAQAGAALDATYLATLSDDAIPAMISAYDMPGLAVKLRNQVGAALACRAAADQQQVSRRSWTGFNLTQANALSQINLHHVELSAFGVSMGDSGWQVIVDGKTQPCFTATPAD